MQKRTFLITLLSLAFLAGYAQEDPTLFSVADIQVPVSEFRYIYTKNNRDNADYSQASVTEYLDLYTRFKLKVKRARDLQLDTISALQKELAGYRSQLAKSYLNDKEVMDKLTHEAYERRKTDLHVSHILFRVDPNAPDDQVAIAREKARQALDRIKKGESFEKVAREMSEDKTTAPNGGDMGYLTAMLPNGFYNVENTIYSLKDGQISDPVRSTLGIHIFKVKDRRPARGEIEAAHIFVRVKADSSNAAAAEQKINAVYQSLKNGQSFEELAQTVSDDSQTARRGGYIGRFGINSYDPEFEDAAFALENVGDVTEPIRTRVGWHIIRLVNKYEQGSYEDEKNRLEARISRDERVNIAKESMVDKIRVESGLKIDTIAKEQFIDGLKDDFLTFQWDSPVKARTLVTFGNGTEKTTDDFVAFLRTKTRERMRASKSATPQSVGASLFEEWINELCLEYEESNLEAKYPDFRALMREYEEGILLFEVTKMMVWDKASQDTVGLNAFFRAHRDNYMWDERAEVVQVTVSGAQAEKTTAKAKKLLMKQPIDQVAAKLNKKEEVITFTRKRYSRDELVDQSLDWKKGASSAVTKDDMSGNQTFSYVSEILPPQPKALDEARGYVIADYQDELEKQWVRDLREMYPVNVNEKVLSSLIRK